MKTFPMGGVHPSENKLSCAKPIEILPLPEVVTIPLAQHIGAPAVAKVAKGDKVLTGQLIAEAASFMSANIHSPVSGTVTGRRSAAERAGTAPDDDHDQARRRRVGRGYRPFGDPRARVLAFGSGDHRPHQGGRHRRHGRRDVPHARETFCSSRQEGRVPDHQRCGVRTLPYVRPPHDARARRGAHRRRHDPHEGRRCGEGLHRYREQQARRHRAPARHCPQLRWGRRRTPQGEVPAGR